MTLENGGLALPWRAALEEAWSAYTRGSYAIGACVADANGVVLARGRNRLGEGRGVHGTGGVGYISGHDLGHAEINALLALREKAHPDCYGWTVYTSVEPCPQCAGAVAMSSIRGLSYAAPDPWAGAADILSEHRYVGSKNIRVGRAPDGVVRAALRLVLVSFLEAGHDPEAPFLRSFGEYPGDLRAAGELHASGKLRALGQARAGLDEALPALTG
ncbi:MAG: nucleoside deaminase [Deinococcus sp.]